MREVSTFCLDGEGCYEGSFTFCLDGGVVMREVSTFCLDWRTPK